jgi:hypothetical protein
MRKLLLILPLLPVIALARAVGWAECNKAQQIHYRCQAGRGL